MRSLEPIQTELSEALSGSSADSPSCCPPACRSAISATASSVIVLPVNSSLTRSSRCPLRIFSGDALARFVLGLPDVLASIALADEGSQKFRDPARRPLSAPSGPFRLAPLSPRSIVRVDERSRGSSLPPKPCHATSERPEPIRRPAPSIRSSCACARPRAKWSVDSGTGGR